MKAYTDLKQSKKLAEILPIESADMHYHYDFDFDELESIPTITEEDDHFVLFPKDVRCWSLAALLNILDYPQLSKDKLGSGKEGWMVSAYPDDCRNDSCWHDNPIDCCVEMICKLDENVEWKPWEWDGEKKELKQH